MGICCPRRSLSVLSEVSVATANQWSELGGFLLRQRRSMGCNQPVLLPTMLSLHCFFGT